MNCLLDRLPCGDEPLLVISHSYENLLITLSIFVVAIEIISIKVLTILNLARHVSIVGVISFFKVGSMLYYWHRCQKGWLLLRICWFVHRSVPGLECPVGNGVLTEIKFVSFSLIISGGHIFAWTLLVVPNWSNIRRSCCLALLSRLKVVPFWCLSAGVPDNILEASVIVEPNPLGISFEKLHPLHR